MKKTVQEMILSWDFTEDETGYLMYYTIGGLAGIGLLVLCIMCCAIYCMYCRGSKVEEPESEEEGPDLAEYPHIGKDIDIAELEKEEYEDPYKNENKIARVEEIELDF